MGQSLTAPFATGTANFFRTDGTARRPPFRDAAARSPPQERSRKTPWLDRQRKDLLKEHRPPRELRVLERENPTLFLANNFSASPRDIITNDARRNGVEDALGSNVSFFHLDCLSREVRLNVDLDSVLTVLPNGCYRWLERLTGAALDRLTHRCHPENATLLKASGESYRLQDAKRRRRRKPSSDAG